MKILRPLYKSLAIVIVVISLNSCHSSKTATQREETAYRREPIKERSEESVRTDAIMIDAKMQQLAGNSDKAAQLYQQIITRDPYYDAAYYEMSHIMAGERQLDSALFFAERAVALNGKNVWYLLHTALLYKYMERSDDLIRTWERIVNQNPEVLEYYFELSNAYLAADNTPKAIATLERIEARIGISETVSMQKAKLWNSAGDTKKAMQEIILLAETMPHETKYNAIIAESYMQNGQYSKAKIYYDRILASNPNDEYIHISLAEYYKQSRQPREAYEELRKGFLQNSLTTKNKIQILSNFYTPTEFYDTYSTYAFDLLDVIMTQSSDSISYAAFYGDVLMRQQKYDEASRQFALALTADSSHYELWDALLVCMLQSPDHHTQMDIYAERAIQFFPLHPLPHLVRAIVAHDLGRYGDAIPHALRCEQLGFDHGRLEAETYTLLAECYSRLGDKRCRDYYEKYLNLRTNDINTLNSYAYHLAVCDEELEKAEQMSRQTLKAQPDNPNFLDTYAWVLYRMGRIADARTFIEKAYKIFIQKGEVPTDVTKHYNTIMQ